MWSCASSSASTHSTDRLSASDDMDRARPSKEGAQTDAASDVAASAPPGQARAIVEAHNRYRAQHCADPLRWSAELASVAQAWADQLRDRGCAFGHSQSSEYGENLFFAAPSSPTSGVAAVDTWYAEHQRYRFSSPGFSMRTGHFTQVVWRGTRELGCGTAQCNGGDIWVCNYSPPGNMIDAYRQNVLPTSCR